MGKRVGVAVLAGLVACGGARAATYPAIYSFGDSLSDVGNLSAATAGTIPLPGFYYNGRFSNGPNWLDDLSAKLGLSTGPALLGGDNFAVGGAQTGETIVNSPPVPVIGLTDQVKSRDVVYDVVVCFFEFVVQAVSAAGWPPVLSVSSGRLGIC